MSLNTSQLSMPNGFTTFESSLNSKMLSLTSKLIFLAGIAWGLMYMFFEIHHASFYPFLYSSVMGVVILLHEKKVIGERILLNSNLFMILVVPAMLQVSVGTYSNSGVVVLWSTFAPTGSLLFQGLRRALFWFFAFLVVVFILAAYEAFLLEEPSVIDPNTVIVFSLMNISAVTTVLFLSLRFYVKELIRKQTEINKLLEEEAIAKQSLNEKAIILNEHIEEKDIMLKEIHHRVKNNLQVITSLLSLQNSFIEKEEIKSIFKKSQNRINSMAMIHEMLYQSDQLSRIEFEVYAKALINNIIETMSPNSEKISLEIESQEIFLNLDTAIPLALIVNEIATNALKYGISNMDNGNIFLKLDQDEEKQFHMIIGDNGPGMDQSKFDHSRQSLGMMLIKNLSLQIQGKIELMDTEKGSVYKLIFREV